MSKYLQPNEHAIVSADVKVDVRSHASNAETPVPWADLAKPKHFGTITLTTDRLLIVFNPGNVRVVSVPLSNVLMAWERTSEGRKPYPNQVVFVLPAGIFCVCELEGLEIEPITALRRIVHTVTRMGNLGAKGDTTDSTAGYGDDGGAAAALVASGV